MRRTLARSLLLGLSMTATLHAGQTIKCFSCPKPPGETSCKINGKSGTWGKDETINGIVYHVCVISGLITRDIDPKDAFLSEAELQEFSARNRREVFFSTDQMGGYGDLAAPALSSGFTPRRVFSPDGDLSAPAFGATSVDSDPLVGIGTVLGIRDWLALDLGFSYGTGTASRRAPSGPRSTDREEIEFRLLSGHANARVYPFRTDRVKPYLSAGVRGLSVLPTGGVYTFGDGTPKLDVEGRRFESSSTADFTAGAGVEVRLADRFGLAISGDHGFSTGWRAGVNLTFAVPRRSSVPFPAPPESTGVLIPDNPKNPFDSYGKLHNEMLDFVARQRSTLETRGVVLPGDVVDLLTREAWSDIQRAGGPTEGCQGDISRRIFSIGLAADSPLDHLSVRAGYSLEQSREVEEISAAISLPPEAAISRIKEIEEGVLRRTGIGPGGGESAPGIIYGDPGHPLPACPFGWPPPCDFWCPSRLGDCVPLPPVGRQESPTGTAWNDRTILMASSVARFSIAYWNRQTADPASPWKLGNEAQQAPRYDEDKLARADFSGMVWGGIEGLFTGGIGGALVGSVSGMVFSSIREAGTQFGWW